MTFELLTAIGAGIAGWLFATFSTASQESVKGYLILRNARRHVLDMLVTETKTGPCTIRGGAPGRYVVTSMRHSVNRATREALKAYLEAVKRSPLRRKGDRRAVEALAPRLQFETAEIGKLDFLAICKHLSPRKAQKAIGLYAELTRKAVTESAQSLVSDNAAAAMGADECAAIAERIERVWQALPGRPRRRSSELAMRQGA